MTAQCMCLSGRPRARGEPFHRDFSTTRLYVHQQVQSVRDAMERARMGQGWHSSWHNSAAPIETSTILWAVS